MDVGTFNFEYLVLERVPDEKRKTLLVSVLSRRHGDLLGMIRWYGPWRQYVFVPEPGTLYSHGCMSDIETAIRALMDDRKTSRASD
jgi:hypothetical protein